LFGPYALDLTGFRAVLLFLQQNQKQYVVHVLAYLPRLDLAVKSNSKSGCAFGNNMKHFQEILKLLVDYMYVAYGTIEVNNPIITNHNLRLCGMTNWELGSAVE
jgi:hypothetical protein